MVYFLQQARGGLYSQTDKSMRFLADSLKYTLDVTENNRFNQSMLARFSLVGPPAILFFKMASSLETKELLVNLVLKSFVAHINNLQ